jgi:hypothetical protein
MQSHKTAARVFGIFFIIAFLSYGIGSGLVNSIASSPNYLANVYANKTTIVVGVILMALVHSFVNIGLPVILLPILKPFNRYLTYGYLSAAIAATVVLVVGAIFLLLLVPLSDEFVKTGSITSSNFDSMGVLLKKGGAFSYQLGMALWGLGGLMFVSVLYKSKLVPRLFSYWGFVGYIVFVAGTILELFGNNVGVILSIPGGLFEIFLSLWLIVKGFNSSVIVSTPAK